MPAALHVSPAAYHIPAVAFQLGMKIKQTHTLTITRPLSLPGGIILLQL